MASTLSAGVKCRSSRPPAARRRLRPCQDRTGLRQCAGRHGARLVQSPSVPGSPPRRESDRRRRDLHCEPVVGHDQLQGHDHAGGAAGVLPGPQGSAHGVVGVCFPPAVLDQYVARVAPGTAVPLPRAQRRDQHDPGQSQLGDCAGQEFPFGQAGRHLATSTRSFR